MPKSDDQIQQIREQRGQSAESASEFIARKSLERIPFAGMAIEYVRERAQQEKQDWFDSAVLDVLAAHEVSIHQIKEKLESENIMRVIAAAAEEIFWGASDEKIRRFAAVVANVVEADTNPQELEDAKSFIRALDELSEDDIRCLKHLYNHQSRLVAENHAMPYNSFFPAMNDMLADTRNLGMQMDDVFARFSRLTGYGLALELPTRHATMGNPDDFAFRLTLLGKRLMLMLIAAGEDMVVTRRR